MLAWFTILRPLNLFLAGISVVLTMTILGEVSQIDVLILLIFSVMAINGGGNVINDIYDLEIDRINRPKRPLPSGALTVEAAWAYTFALFGLGVLLSTFLTRWTFIIAAFVSIPLLAGYSVYFKRMILLGNLVVSIMLGLAFIYVGAALDQIPATLPIAGLAFGFTVIREIVKDLEDMAGDRQVGARTLPLVWGEKNTLLFTVVIILLFSFLDLLPYRFRVYDSDYLWWVMFGVNVPLWICALLLWYRPGRSTYCRVQTFLKIDIFIGLVAIYLGASA